MARTIKMSDMPLHIALTVFQMLNLDRVEATVDLFCYRDTIITDVEPKDLTYPEGWYYAKGYFRNKHTSTTGGYDEVRMETSDGRWWYETAKYCTL